MRILLIEDSPRLGKYVQRGLQKAGYAVDWTDDGETGQWQAESSCYDVIVLDLMLPKRNGLEILKFLGKKFPKTHVLILTAKDTIEERVEGLQAGADDYLVKPFAMEELVARVRALLRRKYEHKSTVIRIGDLKIDLSTQQASKNDQPLQLPPREYALLEYLALRRGQVVSRSEIEEHIYDDLTEPLSNVIDAAVYSLRKALDNHGKSSWITTRRGRGYMLEDPMS